MNEPKDICCICNAVGEDGEFTEVNAVDFEILCPKCSHKRCTNCKYLIPNSKTLSKRHGCKYRGKIPDHKNTVCDHWEQ